MDLVKFLARQRLFSRNTFGAGKRTEGVLDHIEQELEEVRKSPTDLEEWIDVVLLALDGASRQGYAPEQIAAMLDIKLTKNELRTWPPLSEQHPTKATNHVKPGVAKLPSPHTYNWIKGVREPVRDTLDRHDARISPRTATPSQGA